MPRVHGGDHTGLGLDRQRELGAMRCVQDVVPLALRWPGGSGGRGQVVRLVRLRAQDTLLTLGRYTGFVRHAAMRIRRESLQ